MPTFMLSLNWTDQGIRAVKESPKRAQAGRELAKKVGVEIKQLFLTSGDCDIVLIVDAPDGEPRIQRTTATRPRSRAALTIAEIEVPEFAPPRR